jgi:hypothetical protein
MDLFGTTGQERRAWINNQGDRFANALNYYLGPTGIPDKLNALAQAAEFTDAGDFMEAGDASRALVRDPSISNAARMSAAGAALAIPFVSARMMNEGTDILGSVVDDFMTGYDPNRLNMFAGPRARTADRNALATAQEMTQAGASRDDVWRDTGWFRGVDGQWRFEIDDSAMRFRRGTIDEVNLKRRGVLGNSLEHDELFAAYPDAREIRFQPGYDMEGYKAGYYPDDDMIKINRVGRAWSDPQDFQSSSLHEMQHAVQQREGFHPGGNYFTTVGDDFGFAQDQLNERIRAGAYNRFDDWRNTPEIRQKGWSHRQTVEAYKRDNPSDFEFLQAEEFQAMLSDLRQRGARDYHRLAGEVEARNVQTRRDFTPEQRRATPPWATQDVPDDEQIIRGASSGPMASNALAPAEARAQEVLDLLASGRAAEVTDEMMAAADPQYLFRNYDLPMDVDNRMYRASEMGFPVHKYDGESYHLTPNDVQAFNVGHTSTPDHPREAVWARVDPRTNPAAHNVGRDFNAEGTNDMPLFIRGERAMPFEAREMPDGEYLPYAVSKDWADAARASGKTQYELGNERVSIDPANIRSRFARFDPRLSHLRNLSAGAAGTAILANSGTEEERSNDIRALLDKYGVQY